MCGWGESVALLIYIGDRYITCFIIISLLGLNMVCASKSPKEKGKKDAAGMFIFLLSFFKEKRGSHHDETPAYHRRGFQLSLICYAGGCRY